MRFAVLVALLVASSRPASAQWKVPATRTVDVSETYFGKTYKDPYRWLEDLGTDEVKAWFKAQADVTDKALATIPGRDKLAAEWMKLDALQPTVTGRFSFQGGRLFYFKRLGNQDRYKLYVREGWTGPEQLLFDPDSYKAGGKTVVNSYKASPDGKHVVMGLTADGAEWSELRVLDVDKRALLPERIYPSYGASGWAADNVTFFYDAGTTTDTKSPSIELDRQAHTHKLGTDVASDRDVFSNKSYPSLGIASREIPSAAPDRFSPDVLIASPGTVQHEQRVFVAPAAELKNGHLAWRSLVQFDDKIISELTIDRGSLYGMTYVDAARYKLVRTSLARPDWKHAETVVAEAKDVLEDLVRSKNYLFLMYNNGVESRVVRLDLKTRQTTELSLPMKGIVGMSCPDSLSDHCVIYLTTWTQPDITYELEGTTGAFTKSVFSGDVTIPGMADIAVEEVEVPSHDGTMVPLSILHKKGQKLDGSASAILTGYGAYGSSYSPSFDVKHSLLSHGVVIAYAHVRGGSEKGDAWYKAGLKTTKPNTWLDFIAAADYLVKKHYTSPGKLAGTGTSAGGILISRAITARPDLFAAAVVNVGCANALRMEFSPNGPPNVPEFGTVKDQTEAAALYEMDGVAHIKPATKYPAMMAVAGWNDPRVSPWQPGKFAAAMQASSTSGKPVLLKVNYDNGHFINDRKVTYKNFSDQYSFMLWQTGHPEFQAR